jgi:hypothetical protein
MGEPEATNLMDMPSNVRTNILKFLWAGEYDAWEYEENGRILTVHISCFPLSLMRAKSK